MLNKYMTVPFRDHGRTLEGLDCWGLVRLVRHEVFGQPLLESFGHIAPSDKQGMTQSYAQVVQGFSPGRAKEGAIACHFIGDTLIHVGIVVATPQLKVLHTGRCYQRPVLTPLREFERMALITRYYA